MRPTQFQALSSLLLRRARQVHHILAPESGFRSHVFRKPSRLLDEQDFEIPCSGMKGVNHVNGRASRRHWIRNRAWALIAALLPASECLAVSDSDTRSGQSRPACCGRDGRVRPRATPRRPARPADSAASEVHPTAAEILGTGHQEPPGPATPGRPSRRRSSMPARRPLPSRRASRSGEPKPVEAESSRRSGGTIPGKPAARKIQPLRPAPVPQPLAAEPQTA